MYSTIFYFVWFMMAAAGGEANAVGQFKSPLCTFLHQDPGTGAAALLDC